MLVIQLRCVQFDTVSFLSFRFEDLKVDAVREVMKMLDYLNIDYLPEEVEARLHTDYGKFQRYQYTILLH